MTSLDMAGDHPPAKIPVPFPPSHSTKRDDVISTQHGTTILSIQWGEWIISVADGRRRRWSDLGYWEVCSGKTLKLRTVGNKFIAGGSGDFETCQRYMRSVGNAAEAAEDSMDLSLDWALLTTVNQMRREIDEKYAAAIAAIDDETVYVNFATFGVHGFWEDGRDITYMPENVMEVGTHRRGFSGVPVIYCATGSGAEVACRHFRSEMSKLNEDVQNEGQLIRFAKKSVAAASIECPCTGGTLLSATIRRGFDARLEARNRRTYFLTEILEDWNSFEDYFRNSLLFVTREPRHGILDEGKVFSHLISLFGEATKVNILCINYQLHLTVRLLKFCNARARVQAGRIIESDANVLIPLTVRNPKVARKLGSTDVVAVEVLSPTEDCLRDIETEITQNLSYW